MQWEAVFRVKNFDPWFFFGWWIGDSLYHAGFSSCPPRSEVQKAAEAGDTAELVTRSIPSIQTRTSEMTTRTHGHPIETADCHRSRIGLFWQLQFWKIIRPIFLPILYIFSCFSRIIAFFYKSCFSMFCLPAFHAYLSHFISISIISLKVQEFSRQIRLE